jgi:endonuclease YncB( thermonuclease family)
MEELIKELLKIYNNTNKKNNREWLKEIINRITKSYILTISKWNVRERWLANKYYIIWKLNVKYRKNSYKIFTLDDYKTWARVVEVYDGDTIKVLLNFRGNIDKWIIRMNGYDSPEMKPLRNKFDREKEIELAIIARDKLIEKTRGIIYIKIVGFDKYGRLLSEVYNEGCHINKWMIDNGYGYSYNGGKKR